MKVETNITEEELNIFSDLILNDERVHRESDIRNNRNFEAYDIPELEACSKNKDKSRYTLTEITSDLSFYFPYLPKVELQRLAKAFLWLTKEALKNYGLVSYQEFGKFTTYDRPYRVRYNPSTGKKYTVPLMKVRRVIEFSPNPSLKNILTPRTLQYMRTSPVNVELSDIPCLFTSYAKEKRHRRQGQLLIQKAFDDYFRFLGYNDAYISAIYNGDL